MLRIILSVLLIQSCLSACDVGDRFECQSSLCATYYWSNGVCTLNTSSPCTSQISVPSGSTCTTCANLTSSECSSICIDWYFNTTSNLCQTCSSKYGADCIECTSSACTQCSFSSGKRLASDNMSCVACAVGNCTECYNASGVERCYRCNLGYGVNSSYGCITWLSRCSIPFCRLCFAQGSYCSSCYQGYVLSPLINSCQPICTEHCLNCLKPNYCYTCVSGYRVVDGVCTVDCTGVLVANCASCTTLSACNDCNSGFTSVIGGAYCTPNCNDPNCLVCSSSAAGACTTCNTGYSISTGTCSSIICVVPYCQTCSDLSTCSACQSQFTLVNGACQPACSAAVPGCLLCTDASNCMVCNRGYSLANNTCTAMCSIANCLVCGSASTCITCQSGYILTGAQSTCTMTCSVANCDICNSTTVCSSCIKGYTLSATNSSLCVPQCGFGQANYGTTSQTVCYTCGFNIINCYICDVIAQNVFCLECVPGYFRNGFELCERCSDIIPNCKNCTSPYNCTTCQNGYTLINKNCVATGCASTVTNCILCASTSTSCTTCASGFTLAGGACSVSCSSSQIFDPAAGACVCPSSAYISNGGVCNNCLPNCKTCSIISCTSCDQGYYLDGGVCLACSANCVRCISPTVCTLCDDAFFPMEGGCWPINDVRRATGESASVAYLCPIGCRRCRYNMNKTVRCMETEPGYSMIYKIVIIACDPVCKTCSGPSSINCTSCYQGYTFRKGQCFACSDTNAISCSPLDLAYSVGCIFGYTDIFYSGAGGAQFSGGVCRACATNCRKCDQGGPGTCDDGECYVGYQKLQGQTNCTTCLRGCSSCSTTDLNVCLNCPNGQFGTPGTCSYCDANCLTCSSSATTCTSCSPGSTLVNSTCYVLPQNCFALSTVDASCSACFQGYILSNGACVFNISCNTTVVGNNANASCFICDLNHYIRQGRCFACPTTAVNCLSCDPYNRTNCIKCNDGFYVSGNTTCTACGTGCLTCSSSAFCTKASAGYFIVMDQNKVSSGLLLSCTSPCATCQSDSKNCLSCVSGYKLQGTTCISVNSVSLYLVLSPSGSNQIPINSGVPAQNLAGGMAQINRIRATFCASLPPANFPGSTTANCQRFIHLIQLRGGSLLVDLIVSGGAYSSNTAARSGVLAAFSSNTALDGMTITSAAASASGFSSTTGGALQSSSSSSSSSNTTALIIGVVLGGLILLVLIFLAILKVRRNKTKKGSSSFPSSSNIHSSEHIGRKDNLNKQPEAKVVKKEEFKAQPSNKASQSNIKSSNMLRVHESERQVARSNRSSRLHTQHKQRIEEGLEIEIKTNYERSSIHD